MSSKERLDNLIEDLNKLGTNEIYRRHKPRLTYSYEVFDRILESTGGPSKTLEVYFTLWKEPKQVVMRLCCDNATDEELYAEGRKRFFRALLLARDTDEVFEPNIVPIYSYRTLYDKTCLT